MSGDIIGIRKDSEEDSRERCLRRILRPKKEGIFKFAEDPPVSFQAFSNSLIAILDTCEPFGFKSKKTGNN